MKSSFWIQTVIGLAFVLMLTTTANAQASRTWVSGVGDDANPCSRTAPCKTWAGAISKTFTGGEIDTIDAGSFGALTITKSITVDGRGLLAGTLHTGGINGMTINFDSFSGTDTRKTVHLRNITFQGSGATTTGARGIRIVGGSAITGGFVSVHNCIIEGSTGSPGRGIEDARTGGGRLAVTHTLIQNLSGTGIVVLPSSGSTRIDAMINSVTVTNCAFGIVASNGSRVTVTNSVISGNANHGLAAEGAVGASELHVNSCQISSNGTGLRQDPGGTVRVGNSDITFNTSNGTVGTILSYGNNRAAGNGGATTLTAIGADSHDKGQQ